LDSLVYFPRYQGYKDFTPEEIDPTWNIIIDIYTIDKYFRQLVLCGVAILNVFIDEQGRQPQSKDVTEYNLNEGAHQIPLYLSNPKKDYSEGIHSKALKRPIPCCSVLVRIEKLVEPESEPIPAPNYKDRVYVSDRNPPLQLEKILFGFLTDEKANKTVRDILLDMKDVVRAKSDTIVSAWINKCLSTDKKSIPNLSLNHLIKYNNNWGFKVSVDSASRLKNKAYSSAIISLYPPGSLYTSKESSRSGSKDDINYNQKLNFNSEIRSPVWDDGFQWFSQWTFHARRLLVIDIRCLGYSDQEKKQNLMPQGWTVLPIFAEGSEYILFGKFQLPLVNSLYYPAIHVHLYYTYLV
jgi:hypothetical protein